MGINKDLQKAPNLRFKGFTDDWEQGELIDVSKITMGQSPNGANYTQNPRDHILVQGNADMKNGEVVPRIWTTQVTKVANVNDIILGVRAPVGVVGITKYDVVIGRGVAGIKGNTFIYYDLVHKYYNGYWTKYSTGSTFDSINTDDIKSASIHLPNFEEQTRIGSFLKNLDNTITLHQRKLDQLNQLKEALLQQMFPGKGETVPKLRFTGFEGDWEELKLSAVVDKQIKGKAQADKLNPGNVEYLDTARLNGGEPFLTDGISNVMKDDILILWDGSKAGTVYIGFEGALGSTLKAYRTNSDSQFVFQYLKRYQEHIYNNYRTPNIPHVQKDFLEVFTIKVPTMKEQTKIGNTLKHLDNTIILYQCKLDQLQNMKQVLLQNMFI